MILMMYFVYRSRKDTTRYSQTAVDTAIQGIITFSAVAQQTCIKIMYGIFSPLIILNLKSDSKVYKCIDLQTGLRLFSPTPLNWTDDGIITDQEQQSWFAGYNLFSGSRCHPSLYFGGQEHLGN